MDFLLNFETTHVTNLIHSLESNYLILNRNYALCFESHTNFLAVN